MPQKLRCLVCSHLGKRCSLAKTVTPGERNSGGGPPAEPAIRYPPGKERHTGAQKSTRVLTIVCLFWDRRNAFDIVLTLDVQGGGLSSEVNVNSMLEEIYVTAGQLVFRGVPLYQVVRLGYA